jgi:TetR/AcrR family transcriptional repressor of nem operon
MELFWEQGYESTSVQQLVARTGVHKRSMYEAFGDKHALFALALERYADGQRQLIDATVAGTGSPLQAIRALLEFVLPDGPEDPSRGCMLTNSATEVAARDAEAAKQVELHIDLCRRVLHDLVERGQQVGEIAARLDAGTIAEVLLNAWLGLRVQTRAGRPREQLQAGIDAALAVLA